MLAVDGVAATSGLIDQPFGVAADADGNVYISGGVLRSGVWVHSWTGGLQGQKPQGCDLQWTFAVVVALRTLELAEAEAGIAIAST